MKRLRWSLVVLAVMGCGGESNQERAEPARPAPRVTLHVAAASDLQLALPVVVEAYRREHPDVEVVTTLGASGQLAEQIKEGAPFAVFLSANESYVKTLLPGNLIVPESARPYALGSLAMVSGRDAKAHPEKLSDLASPEYRRIAIANPDIAPFGEAARQTLKKSGLWSKLRLQLVFAESVRQALQFVETGGAEVGLVSKALIVPERFHVVDVDPGDHAPIVQWLGVVARTPPAELKEAERFADFVVSNVGVELLGRFGMKAPNSTTSTTQEHAGTPERSEGADGAR